MYAVIVEVATQRHAPQPGAHQFVLVLGLVAVVEAALVPILRKKKLPPRRTGSEPVGDQIDAAAAHALGRYYSVQIITWALCEAVGIFGLVCAFFIGNPVYFFPFGGAGLALMLAYAPKRAQLEAVVRAAGSD